MNPLEIVHPILICGMIISAFWLLCIVMKNRENFLEIFRKEDPAGMGWKKLNSRVVFLVLGGTLSLLFLSVLSAIIWSSELYVLAMNADQIEQDIREKMDSIGFLGPIALIGGLFLFGLLIGLLRKMMTSKSDQRDHLAVKMINKKFSRIPKAFWVSSALFFGLFAGTSIIDKGDSVSGWDLGVATLFALLSLFYLVMAFTKKPAEISDTGAS